MRVPSLKNRFHFFDVEIVHADIPLLPGLVNLKAQGLFFNYLDDILEHRIYGFTISIKYKNEHSFLEWNYTNIFFTGLELKRLHLHFLHLNTDKLQQLLQ